MAKQKSIKDRRNDEVYDLMYSRKLCVDPNDDIELTQLNTRPLSAVVSSSTLPTFTEMNYNPKKGTFTERKVQANADEVIVNNAERHQGRLSAHMMTGQTRDTKHEKAQNALYPHTPMGSQFSGKRKLKGY
jgi:hypothetical protein